MMFQCKLGENFVSEVDDMINGVFKHHNAISCDSEGGTMVSSAFVSV